MMNVESEQINCSIFLYWNAKEHLERMKYYMYGFLKHRVKIKLQVKNLIIESTLCKF